MKNKIFPKLCIVGALLLFIYSGCNKDLGNVNLPTWSPTIALPLLSTSLSLDEIIEESENIQYDDDHLIRLVFSEDSIVSVAVSDLIDIPSQDPIIESYTLGIIEIPNFNIFDSVTLETTLGSLDPEIAAIFVAADGTNAYFPPFTNTSPIEILLPPLEGITSAHLSNGNFSLVVTNTFPVILSNLHVELRNIVDNSKVFEIEIEDLFPGVTESFLIDLGGKEITGEMKLVTQVFSSPGSGNNPLDTDSWVFVDLTDGVLFDIIGSELEVSSGIAEIEAQTFSVESNEFALEIDDYELNQIDFKNTFIDYSVTSNIQADININLVMPDAHYINSGATVSITIYVPYSANGDPVTGQIDLSNSSFDLSGSPNSIAMDYELEIIPINDLIEFDSSNKVQFELGLSEIDFSLVKGFLGKNTFDFDEGAIDLNLDFLDQFDGDFTLDGATIKLNYFNSIGLPIAVKFDMLGVDNEGNTQALNYQSSPGNDTMYFDFPQTTGASVSNTILISAETSDIDDLLALSPKRIEYSGTVATNTFGGGQDNFVTDESMVTLGFEINTPISIKASNLGFQDTVNINLGDSLDIDVNFVDLKMNVINGFPFDMDLQLILIDSLNMHHLDTIGFSDPIASGELNADGKVESPVKSEVSVRIDQSTFENLKMSNKSIIKARISTGNGGQQAVKFYSNYELEVFIAVLAELKIEEL